MAPDLPRARYLKKQSKIVFLSSNIFTWIHLYVVHIFVIICNNKNIIVTFANTTQKMIIAALKNMKKDCF
jgi:hypothetical protein